MSSSLTHRLLHPVLHNSNPYLVIPVLKNILLSEPSRDTRFPPQEKLLRNCSSLCSSKTESKLFSSNLTIVIFQWSLCLFVSISCLQTIPSLNSLFMFPQIPSRNLPIFVYLAFLFHNIPLATSHILNICGSLNSLVFVPCSLSLPIYKIAIYIDIEKEPSNEYY